MGAGQTSSQCVLKHKPFLWPSLSWSHPQGFQAATEEIYRECGLLRQKQQPIGAAGGGDGSEAGGPGFLLRLFLESIRLLHVSSEVPLEYLCPLTFQLMWDPVILVATGHSYERKAIEEWWAK
jgi:hypothetical protein